MIGTRGALSGPAAYRVMEGVGATAEEFMKMALDAARALLLRAEAQIAAGDQVGKAKSLASASNVVEFMLGLSGVSQGELSRCLASVYEYALAAIAKGNAGDDAEALAAGRTALEELAVTWRNIFPDSFTSDETGGAGGMNRSLSHA